MATAGFDRAEDHWPRRWAEAYVDFAAGEKRSWLHAQGMRWFPAVGWAERGAAGASASGNSVPRFHVTWGTGPGVLEPFERRVRGTRRRPVVSGSGSATACARSPSPTAWSTASTAMCSSPPAPRAARAVRAVPSASSRSRLRPWSSPRAGWAATTSWCAATGLSTGSVPRLPSCSPVCRSTWTGLLQQVVARGRGAPHQRRPDVALHRGAAQLEPDLAAPRYPHPAGAEQPLARIPDGQRLPYPHIPGADTLGTLQHITTHGYPYTWFLLNRAIIKKEFALSGSEQNPDLTGKSVRLTLRRIGKSVQAPVQAFMDQGADFVVRDTLRELVAGMNELNR